MNAIQNDKADIISSPKVEKVYDRMDTLVDAALAEKQANDLVRSVAKQLVLARNTGKGWVAINALVTRLEEALKI